MGYALIVAGQELYIKICELIPKLKSRQSRSSDGAGGGASGSGSSNKKKKKR